VTIQVKDTEPALRFSGVAYCAVKDGSNFEVDEIPQAENQNTS